jgi:ADP-ribosyl-[dinitrogen reductase] hydrolase
MFNISCEIDNFFTIFAVSYQETIKNKIYMSIKAMILGGFVGDALGVPVEFVDRTRLNLDPVINMREYGTHHQPKGTWSDDSSMTYALAESIIEGYNDVSLAEKFVRWFRKGHYTPHGIMFDIGMTTIRSITNFESSNFAPSEAGCKNESDNGNGSLMRISPLIVLLKPLETAQRFQLVKEVSSITHGHIRSVLACFYLCEFLIHLDNIKDKYLAFQESNKTLVELMKDPAYDIPLIEQGVFARITSGQILTEPENLIFSSGYVMHTLEATLWCFMNTTNYADCVLKAINLGGDSDTTGAVAGNIAGMFYGMSGIHQEWLNDLVKLDEVDRLAEELESL